MAEAALKEELVKTCNIESIESISRENKEGVFVVVTQPNCGSCEPFFQEAEKVIGQRLPIVEANLEDENCKALATQLKIAGTPAAVYFKDGKEVARLDPAGKTWDSVRNEIAEMIKKGSESAARSAETSSGVPASP